MGQFADGTPRHTRIS